MGDAVMGPGGLAVSFGRLVTSALSAAPVPPALALPADGARLKPVECHGMLSLLSLLQLKLALYRVAATNVVMPTISVSHSLSTMDGNWMHTLARPFPSPSLRLQSVAFIDSRMEQAHPRCLSQLGTGVVVLSD